MIGSYFEERLANLPNFDGFFPRLYLPSSNMVSKENPEGLNSHQSMAVIDTKKEIEVGVGYDWPPTVLAADEIMIPEQLGTYLGVGINSTVTITFGLDSINQNLQPNLLDTTNKLLLIATEGSDMLSYDEHTGSLTREGQSYQASELLGSKGLLNEVKLDFVIKGMYQDVNGKFN